MRDYVFHNDFFLPAGDKLEHSSKLVADCNHNVQEKV